VGDQKGEDFGFIMPKSSDWAAVFNEFMAANGGFTKSVEYRKILAENLGSHVLKLMDAITK
jgi:putative glutamine transport system substrate-binding protein